MKLIEATQLDLDLNDIQSNIEMITLSVSSTVQILNNAHSSLWSLPNDRLINILNKLGPEKTQELFNKHFDIATAANAFLDSVEFLGGRAIVTRGKEIALGEDGMFTIKNPPLE